MIDITLKELKDDLDKIVASYSRPNGAKKSSSASASSSTARLAQQSPSSSLNRNYYHVSSSTSSSSSLGRFGGGLGGSIGGGVDSDQPRLNRIDEQYQTSSSTTKRSVSVLAGASLIRPPNLAKSDDFILSAAASNGLYSKSTSNVNEFQYNSGMSGGSTAVESILSPRHTYGTAARNRNNIDHVLLSSVSLSSQRINGDGGGSSVKSPLTVTTSTTPMSPLRQSWNNLNMLSPNLASAAYNLEAANKYGNIY